MVLCVHHHGYPTCNCKCSFRSARRHFGTWRNRAIFVCPWKIVSVSVCYLLYQPVDEKNKTWLPNMEKALFDWPIVLQYDVVKHRLTSKYRLISTKFFGHEVFSAERSLNQPIARCVCIPSIHQSSRSISVRLLFLFCSRLFIPRSYENRSNSGLPPN